MVVMVPPAMATPWKTTAYSGRFGAMIARTSPLPKPFACSPPASRRVAWSSSPYVITRPVGPSIRAALSARSPADPST